MIIAYLPFAIVLALCVWALLLYRLRKRSKKPQALACHVCGAEADAEFEGEAWCAGCLHVKGSCCGE